MNKIKHFYSSPTAELLVVRFEGGFLTGTNFNPDNHTQYIKGGADDDYEAL